MYRNDSGKRAKVSAPEAHAEEDGDVERITEDFLENLKILECDLKADDIRNEYNRLSRFSLMQVFRQLMQRWKHNDSFSEISLGRALALIHLTKSNHTLSTSQISQLESALFVSSELSEASVNKSLWNRIISTSIVLCTIVKNRWSTAASDKGDLGYLRLISNIQAVLKLLAANTSTDSDVLLLQIHQSQRGLARIISMTAMAYFERNVINSNGKRAPILEEVKTLLSEIFLKIYEYSVRLDEMIAVELNDLFLRTLFRTFLVHDFIVEFVAHLEKQMPEVAIHLVKIIIDKVIVESKETAADRVGKVLVEMSTRSSMIFASLLPLLLPLRSSQKASLRRVLLDIVQSILTKSQLLVNSNNLFDLLLSFSVDSDATMRSTTLRYCLAVSSTRVERQSKIWKAAIVCSVDKSKLVRAHSFRLIAQMLTQLSSGSRLSSEIIQNIDKVVVESTLNELSYKPGSTEYSQETANTASILLPLLSHHVKIDPISLINCVVRGGEPRAAGLALIESILGDRHQTVDKKNPIELTSSEAQSVFSLANQCSEILLINLGTMLGSISDVAEKTKITLDLGKLSAEAMEQVVIAKDTVSDKASLAIGAARIQSAIAKHAPGLVLNNMRQLSNFMIQSLDFIHEDGDNQYTSHTILLTTIIKEFLRASHKALEASKREAVVGMSRSVPEWVITFLEDRLYDLAAIGLGEDALHLLFASNITRARVLAFHLLKDLVCEMKSESSEGTFSQNREEMLATIVRLVGDTVVWAAREIYAASYAYVTEQLELDDKIDDYMKEEKHRLAASEEASKAQEELANLTKIPGNFIPLLQSLCSDSTIPEKIRSGALLSLGRFACLGQSVCGELTPDIVTAAMPNNPLSLRLNAITCIGELISHQPSNSLTSQLYDLVLGVQVCSDSESSSNESMQSEDTSIDREGESDENDVIVRTQASWILSTLILSRVISGSEALQTLAICLLDSDSTCAGVARSFFLRYISIQPKKVRTGLIISLVQEVISMEEAAPATRREAAVAIITVLKPKAADISTAFFRSIARGSTSEETDNIYIATAVRPYALYQPITNPIS